MRLEGARRQDRRLRFEIPQRFIKLGARRCCRGDAYAPGEVVEGETTRSVMLSKELERVLLLVPEARRAGLLMRIGGHEIVVD